MKKAEQTDLNDKPDPTPFVFVLALIIFIGAISYAAMRSPSESSHSYHDYTEEEMAHIDTMRVLLQEAPERSIVTRYDVDNEGEIHLEAIWAWVDSAEVFDALVPGLRIVPGREVSESYILTIKKITYPESSEYDSLDNEFFKANN